MRRDKTTARLRRKKSIRKAMSGTPECPRLSVFRSNLHIYAQVIDDISGKTIISASSNSNEVEEALKTAEASKGKIGVAFVLGQILGKRAEEANIEKVVFDRNGYLYHGRVKALADGVRKAGIKF